MEDRHSFSGHPSVSEHAGGGPRKPKKKSKHAGGGPQTNVEIQTSTVLGNLDLHKFLEEEDYASWSEVCTTMWCHSVNEWIWILACWGVFLVFCYNFLLGLELMGTGAKVLGGCVSARVFGGDRNPLASLALGLLATALVQSSSSTTSIVVSLVGAETITVQTGIYIVMGANIGTSLTSTIVALGHVNKVDQLGRAFAAAILNDFYNVLTVCVLFPVELATGYLSTLTETLVRGADTQDGTIWKGPINSYVKPLADRLLIFNDRIIEDTTKTCSDYYPIECNDESDELSPSSCSRVALITCNERRGDCPYFFDPYATEEEEEFSGVVVFFIGLSIMFVCIFGVTKVLHYMLRDTSTRVIYKATNVNGYIAIAVGAGITLLVQSSSITTCLIVPLSAIGIVRMDQVYPFILGANLGITVTTLLEALATDGNKALQVALAHLLLNITGVLIWYPIPLIRSIPLSMAKQFGGLVHVWKALPFFYVIGFFLFVPFCLLGIATLFESESAAHKALGILLLCGFLAANACIFYWLYRMDGRAIIFQKLEQRFSIIEAKRTVGKDMEYVQAKLLQIAHHLQIYLDDDQDQKQEDHVLVSQKTAVRNLPRDMDWVLAKLARLVEHSGVPISGDHPRRRRATSREEAMDDDSDFDDDSTVVPSIAEEVEHITVRDVWPLISLRSKIIGGLFWCGLLTICIVMFVQDSKQLTALATTIILLSTVYWLWFAYKWNCGRASFRNYVFWREDRMNRHALMTLPRDMAKIQSQIRTIAHHQGYEDLLDADSTEQLS